MKKNIFTNCAFCGTKNAEHIYVCSFPENDGKGGLTIKNEYICSVCNAPFVCDY